MAKKVLIIEDQPQLRSMIVLILRHMRYQPLEAKNGYEGIQITLAEHPALILLDLGLPDMSGIDTAKKIKENPQTRQIPIVALTGSEPRQFEARARQAGMAAYLQKPVSLAMIVKQIETFTRPNAPQLSENHC